MKRAGKVCGDSQDLKPPGSPIILVVFVRGSGFIVFADEETESCGIKSLAEPKNPSVSTLNST